MIMGMSFLVMLLINIFSWNFSTISLMMIAAAVSLVLHVGKGAREQQKKGGAGT